MSEEVDMGLVIEIAGTYVILCTKILSIVIFSQFDRFSVETYFIDISS